MATNDNRRSEARVAASGGPITLNKPKSKRKPRPSAVKAVAQEINPAQGFFEFLKSHNVITIAVGFIIAFQSQALVKQLVSSFIDPLFKLFFGQNLNAKFFDLSFHERTVQITWGAFVYATLNFLFILFVIYVLVKITKLDRLDEPSKYKKIDDKLPKVLN